MICQLPLSRMGQAAAAVGLVFLFGACATTYEVKVNAISHPEKAPGTSYRIVTKNGLDPASDLRTQEAVGYVKTALSGKGMYEAPDPNRADVVVEVDFDVEPPRVKYERSTEPVFARTSGSVRSIMVPVRDASGQVRYRTVSAIEPPQVELIAYEERIIPITVYEKYLRVSARENIPYSETRPPAQLWSVHVSREDSTSDIRADLPVLASTVVDYIGKTTESDQMVRVKRDSADVAFVKRGL
jgi:hypothetical protein